MPLGYPITPPPNATAMFNHAGQCFLAWIPILGDWVGSGYNGSDHYLYAKPPAPPADGDATVWPAVQSTAGGDALLDTRSSGYPMLYADGDDLHVFVLHGSSRRYKRGTFVSGGTITWTIGGEGNGEGVGMSSSSDRIRGVVDAQGRPWFVYPVGSNTVATRVRDGTWQAQLEIDAGAANSDLVCDAFRYVHTDGTEGLGVVYSRTPTEFSFRWRADTDALDAPWRFGWDHTISGFTIDDHLAASAAVAPGDTGSTIIAGCKTNTGDQCRTLRAGPGATPDPNTPLSGSGTRNLITIDATNGIARHCHQRTQNTLRAYEFDLTETMPADEPTPIILINDDSGSYAALSDAPKPPVDSTSGWMFRSHQGPQWWWKDYPIAGGEPTLAIDGATHAHAAANVPLAYDALIAPAELRHPHAAEQVALDLRLEIGDNLHKHVAENVGLTQAIPLVVQSATHPHRAEIVTLAEGAIIAVDELSHPHAAEEITFVPADVLIVAELRHAHRAELLDLIQAGTLVVDDGRHLHRAAEPLLVLDLPLDVNRGRHKHVAETVELDTSTILALAELAHPHRIEPVDLLQSGNLIIAGAAHAHRAANVVLIDDQGKPIVEPAARVYVARDATRVYIERDVRPRII